MSVIVTTTREEFKQHVLQNKKAVLIDFWAEWCPPCRAMAPGLEQFGSVHDDKFDVVKVDIEATPDNGQLAAEHKVLSIPNLIVYKDGKPVKTLVGMHPVAALERELTEYLK
jgi:thioredoxin 1